MREAAEREFQISPKQYQLFEFNVSRPSALYVTMNASAPVDVFLVDSVGKYEYENGLDPVAFTWERRAFIEDMTERAEPGTWYIIVEGREQPSRGHITVLQK
jgi:hypothetical protein